MKAPIFRWLVRAEVLSLGELLERSGHRGALAEGRTFVDRVRTLTSGPIQAGQVVEVYAPMPEAAEPVILARHAGIVAVAKPPGLSSEPDRAGERSVVSWLAEKLCTTREHVVAVSRLDAPVSGVMLLAVDAEACKLLTQAKQDGRLGRQYLAILGGTLARAQGTWSSQVQNKPAKTRYTVLQELTLADSALSRVSLARLEPVTGRMHQLRVHSAAAGAPILGDARNGGARKWVESSGSVREVERLMLHASSVLLALAAGKAFSAAAPVPPEMQRLWLALGGSAEDFLADSVGCP